MKHQKAVAVFVLTLGFGSFAMGSDKQARAQNPPSFPAPPPSFLMNFYGDDDASQCNSEAYGFQAAPFGQLTSPILINTDNRRGGCVQQFAILDPGNVLVGLKVKVNFYPDGNRQCDNPGEREIPIRRDVIEWSSPYRIDTDDRRGGCQQVFSIDGRTDIGLTVWFSATGDAGQCGAASWTQTAYYGHPVQLRIDTDSRVGGCRQQFALHSRDPFQQ